MKEKIADTIFYDKLPKDYGECFEKAAQILSLLEEEIKKVENPYSKAKLASAEYYEGEGFHRACQAILKIVEI